jgi:WD40 repeat protein
VSASSQGGMSDVKELIPEFFFLPDFLENRNRFDFGEHQKGGYCDDVVLPPWARGDPRIFIRLHRRALESKYVSQNLNHWIDLIFGYKQRGKEAEQAQNTYYYLTYEGVVDVSALTDPVQKAATISQINNFGQTPHQVFKKSPHPSRFEEALQMQVNVSSHSHLLRSANVPQSMQLTDRLKRFPRGVYSMHYLKNDKVLSLDANKLLLAPKYKKYMAWGFSDGSLRIRTLVSSPRRRRLDEVVAIHEELHDGPLLCAAVSTDGQVLVTGGQDCVVNVWRMNLKNTKYKKLDLQSALCEHVQPVVCVSICPSFGLIVSASSDGQVILWDLNRLVMLRKLPCLPSAVTCINIDDSNGASFLFPCVSCPVAFLSSVSFLSLLSFRCR